MFPRRHPASRSTMADVTAVDPAAKTRDERRRSHRSPATTSCSRWAPSRTSSTRRAPTRHAFPLYSVDDAERLRSRLLTRVRRRAPQPDADRAGRAELRDRRRRRDRRRDRGCAGGRDQSADPRGRCPSGGSARARSTWSIPRRWCSRRSPTGPMSTRSRCSRSGACTSSWEPRWTRFAADRVVLSDGREILTRTVVWAGGIKVARLAGALRPSAGAHRSGRGRPDLAVHRLPGRVRARRRREHARTRRQAVPAARIGRAAGRDVRRRRTSSPTSPASRRTAFRYRDKGIMAMIGRNAAIAEVGPRRRELHGVARVRVVARGARVAAQRFPRPDRRRSAAWGWDYVA